VSVRCFVGAFVAVESARLLQSATLTCLDQQLLGRRVARQVPLENYHVTLKFLGEIDLAAVPDVLAVVESLAGHGVSGRVTGLTGFPRASAARMVVAELADHPQLHVWCARLEEEFGSEDRRFRPHVTLLRLRSTRAVGAVEFPEPVAVELEAPRLYRSDQTPQGVRYRPLVPG
jgi:2'-5' RNA ligase